MLNNDTVTTYRYIDEIFRLPVVADTVEQGVTLAFQYIQNAAARCLLSAAPPARRDFLFEHDHRSNRCCIKGGVQKPLHFALTVVFPRQVAALDEPGALALVFT